jgi:hypothetical protein
VDPDGRVGRLTERSPPHGLRPISPESEEGVRVLAAGRDILYRFGEERRLRNLSYPDVLVSMRLEIHLAMHKANHAELLDEPEVLPILRRRSS